MNALVDWCVERVYAALEDRGILDDTLLIFTSDNGPMAGQNGHSSVGRLRGQKNTAFEGGHRVPFIARWPDRLEAGSTSDEPFCLIDLYRTLAEVLEVEVPDGAAPDGLALPEAFGLPTGAGLHSRRRRDELVADTGGFSTTVGDFAIRSGDWKLVLLSESGDKLAKRRRPILDAVDGRLLFNLKDDLYESENLLPNSSEVASRLEGSLNEIRQRE
jgi:arylsulfatase A-like enzyme